MASDVRRNFQSQATPVSTPAAQIDDALSSLNDALEDLGKLRIRTSPSKVDLTLTSNEIKAAIDAFVYLGSNMIIPDTFVVPIDVDILRMMPEMMKSSYVKVEPGVYVMYYNALCFGLQQLHGPADPVAHGMYLKVLEAIPAWLNATTVTDMDGCT